jgi:hypothetical protein
MSQLFSECGSGFDGRNQPVMGVKAIDPAAVSLEAAVQIVTQATAIDVMVQLVTDIVLLSEAWHFYFLPSNNLKSHLYI